jgi:two-component system alkaline phosphatase synthesis response regulator PhoP
MGEKLPKLLLIEDDKQLAEMYAKKFHMNGYDVTLAKDGSKGFEKAHAEDFDVIVLDLMLPGISGIEVLEMIRMNKKTALTPIIVYTNYNDPKNKERCITYGADEFILKVDTDPEGLCQTISRVLTERRIEKI